DEGKRRRELRCGNSRVLTRSAFASPVRLFLRLSRFFCLARRPLRMTSASNTGNCLSSSTQTNANIRMRRRPSKSSIKRTNNCRGRKCARNTETSLKRRSAGCSKKMRRRTKSGER
ncbi:DnaJ domain-containing protein, partial [Toxoplasma gondii RUB]